MVRKAEGSYDSPKDDKLTSSERCAKKSLVWNSDADFSSQSKHLYFIFYL